MSRFHTVEMGCPACGARVAFELVASVNVDRAPEWRVAIVDESFQLEACPACGMRFRVDPRFVLVDHGRRLWIGALPLARRSDWAAEESAALVSFDKAYGRAASPGMRAIGPTLRRRVTFGWAGLREKLICDDHGLDDVTVELCKLAVLRSVASAPLGRDTELRLMDADAARLHFAWLQSAVERPIEALGLERAAYDEIAADADGDWAELRSELTAGPFVDIARLTIAAAS